MGPGIQRPVGLRSARSHLLLIRCRPVAGQLSSALAALTVRATCWEEEALVPHLLSLLAPQVRVLRRPCTTAYCVPGIARIDALEHASRCHEGAVGLLCQVLCAWDEATGTGWLVLPGLL